MKIVVVAAARPNYVKAAPLLRALREAAHPPSLRFVDVGQHYDEALAGGLQRLLEMPRPDYSLEVASGSHAEQTALTMLRFEPVLLAERPDVVVVFGDVNATVACALVAAKLGIRVAHVEAGLRSGDRSMPEEINRRATDAVADLFFTTEASADDHLRREGVAPERIHFVGNLMVDSLDWILPRGRASGVRARLGAEAEYAICTLHRPSNVDEPEHLQRMLEALARIAEEIPVLLAAHPRTAVRIRELASTPWFAPSPRATPGFITLLQPLPYLDFVGLLDGARLVLTDSGGVQDESTSLGIPCVTLRDNTERPVTIEVGTNVLGGTNPDAIVAAARRQLRRDRSTLPRPPLWDGRAAIRIADVLLSAA